MIVCSYTSTLLCKHTVAPVKADSAVYETNQLICILSSNFLWDLTLSKLYSNCLMSTLNARSALLDSRQVVNEVVHGVFGNELTIAPNLNSLDAYNRRQVRNMYLRRYRLCSLWNALQIQTDLRFIGNHSSSVCT